MLLKGKSIFMVEDDLANRAISQMLLSNEGAKVAFERWGKYTLSEMKKAAPIDIVLLDLMLPNEISGYDVFLEIRAEEDFKAIPIVAVSAADPETAIIKTKELGFSGFITKPVGFRDFAKQIADILDGKNIWQLRSH